jgi:hypothetical protein
MDAREGGEKPPDIWKGGHIRPGKHLQHLHITAQDHSHLVHTCELLRNPHTRSHVVQNFGKTALCMKSQFPKNICATQLDLVVVMLQCCLRQCISVIFMTLALPPLLFSFKPDLEFKSQRYERWKVAAALTRERWDPMAVRDLSWLSTWHSPEARGCSNFQPKAMTCWSFTSQMQDC